jgi:glycosyltransferase involved in cell wall biosynthesis
MKILQIHKYYSKKRGGGSVSAFFETKKLLEKKGHEVLVFSMEDKDNERANESEYFAKHFDIREAKNFWQKLWLVPRVIYNPDAAHQLDKLLTKYKPDVAHVHNIYHYLTPSIFPILKKHGVPIVFKLSDYHAICPNYKLFAHGKIDNSCKNGKYYKLFFNKSINNSFAESFVAMVEGYVNRWGKFYDNIDIFAAPSEFMREIGVEYGMERKKIRILRNVLNFDAYDTGDVHKQKIFLYMGRVAQEKGLPVAIDAMIKLKKEQKLKGWKFVIAGDGPQLKELEEYVIDNDVSDIVEFAGFCQKGSKEWLNLMQRASVAVLPSVWYDNSPIAISESMAFGSPVIVSDYGGTKEMIQDGKGGFVFETNNSADLATKMQKYIDDENLVAQMGEKARTGVRELNNEQRYYDTLMGIYTEVINKNKK